MSAPTRAKNRNACRVTAITKRINDKWMEEQIVCVDLKMNSVGGTGRL